ncbi:flavin reductase [Pokkaliibacter plantistimulans]|uniref:Flavin reductase n=1 Tax=Proteobacteria bacterium 228 TaxID=2083153 RepID=A0A2S5KLX1_9PROT|nr:NAD(P)H-binding protein [Pokkaliibacter plantistimulans]PPC75653.1 flavin reductase [Pokkaliibacter plantistimulans]
MKVTLFGATGKTGKYLIQEGLKRGYDITVFIRKGSQFNYQNVRVVRGDLTNPDDVRKAVSGSEAVLSALGPTKVSHSKDMPIKHALDNVISVMKSEGINRLIAISTGTAADPGDGFDMKIWLPAQMIRLLLPNIYLDIVGTSNVIRSSGLDWTLVRVALLNNRQSSHQLNVGLYGNLKHTLSIARIDVANFMFDQIDNTEYINKAPGISSN